MGMDTGDVLADIVVEALVEVCELSASKSQDGGLWKQVLNTSYAVFRVVIV